MCSCNSFEDMSSIAIAYQTVEMSQTQRLVEAAKSNDVESLYGLLRENPSLLEDIDGIPFADTPLHVAAAYGSTHFAVEVLGLKPSFGQKLNPDGFSPMHVALLAEKALTVRRLVDCNPELIRVKGKEGCTSLHYVAGVDDSELLAQFLVANKKSIRDLNIRNETAVHVAVKSGSLNAFKVLLKWIKYTGNINILNMKDENDSAALHIEVATNNYEMVRLLIPVANLNMLNQYNCSTALDIAKGFPSNIAHARQIEETLRSAGATTCTQILQVQAAYQMSLAHYLLLDKSIFKQYMNFEIAKVFSSLDNLSGETRSNLLVVSGLIIAATYQAAVLSPPGGLTSAETAPVSDSPVSGSRPGTVNMDSNLFYLLVLFNTFPFLASTVLMILLLPKSKFFVYSLPLVALSVSYGLSAGIISPMEKSSGKILLPIAWGGGFGVIILVFVQVKLFLINRYRNY